MACACEAEKRMRDLSHVRDIAQKMARLEGEMVAIIQKAGGTYGTCPVSCLEGTETIIEYIHYL